MRGIGFLGVLALTMVGVFAVGEARAQYGSSFTYQRRGYGFSTGWALGPNGYGNYVRWYSGGRYGGFANGYGGYPGNRFYGSSLYYGNRRYSYSSGYFLGRHRFFNRFAYRRR
jgi:hypothetical protein